MSAARSRHCGYRRACPPPASGPGETAGALPHQQLVIRPVPDRCRGRGGGARTRSRPLAGTFDSGTHPPPPAPLPRLLRGTRTAPAVGGVTDRLLGGPLLLRPHVRAPARCLLRPDPHRGRRPLDPPPVRTAGRRPAPGGAVLPARHVVGGPAPDRPIRAQSVVRPGVVQRRHGALARSGAVRPVRAEPAGSCLADARELLRHRDPLLAPDCLLYT